MLKRTWKNMATVVISVLLVSQFLFIGEAQASWGAAKLLEIQRQQGGVTNPTVPSEPIPTPAPNPPPIPEPNINGILVGQEQQMLELLNAERVKRGLKPLVYMAQLTDLARLKSQDIIKNNYFSHTSPVYGSFANMVYNAGIRFYSVGENLAKARDARHAFILLLASPGHQANMLSRNFTHVGIGIVQDRYGVVVTQLFVMQ